MHTYIIQCAFFAKPALASPSEVQVPRLSIENVAAYRRLPRNVEIAICDFRSLALTSTLSWRDPSLTTLLPSGGK